MPLDLDDDPLDAAILHAAELRRLGRPFFFSAYADPRDPRLVMFRAEELEPDPRAMQRDVRP